MSDESNATSSSATISPRPEQYLALGSGLHALVERIPKTVYPIEDWNALTKAAASIGHVALIGPGGKKSLQKELQPTISHLRPILGDGYFPIKDSREFAQKAGAALVSLILRRFVPPPFPIVEPLDEKRLATIRALLQGITPQKGA